MATLLEKARVRNFSEPDEVRRFEKGKVELLKIGGMTVGRATFEPGWKWSTCVKPLAGTKSCRSAHLGFVLSGTLMTRMDDGTTLRSETGDIFELPPGHDGWVEGDRPAVIIDFQGMEDYAKP
ncbi:MAG: cupin domain-containing protein [Elusimicrobia bacterium]|nr:cupin domain-containing protein [Elusimicrobiota bacterium]